MLAFSESEPIETDSRGWIGISCQLTLARFYGLPKSADRRNLVARYHLLRHFPFLQKARDQLLRQFSDLAQRVCSVKHNVIS